MKLNRVMKILILLLILSTGYAYASTSLFYSYDDPDDKYVMTPEIFSSDYTLKIHHTITQAFSSIDSISLEMLLYDDDDETSWDLGSFLVSINGTYVDIDIDEIDGDIDNPDILYFDDLDIPSLAENGPTTIDLMLSITPILLSDFYYASSTLTIEGIANSNSFDDSETPTHAPIPSGFLLFASSIIGLLGIRKK